MTQEEIKMVNATARTAGAVGAKALVPKAVLKLLQAYFPNDPSVKVLDYGSGPTAQHAARLREEGYAVTAHEIGDNLRRGVHDFEAMDYYYNLVYASNVLNVLPTREALRAVVEEIRGVCGGTAGAGLFVFNYPSSPRKAGLKPVEVLYEVQQRFCMVQALKGYSGVYYAY